MADRKIPAIPTTYNGIHFRSRLEARWAAFFDLVGWKWQYEPIDLEGYVPDFVLEGVQPLLVEVKPELTLEGLEKHTKKIEETSWSGEALLVGTRPFESTEFKCAGIGLLGERNNEEWLWAGTVLAREPNGERWELSSDLLCYDGRMFFEDPDGNPAWIDSDDDLVKTVRDIWIRAGNAIQWKRK